MLAVFYFCLFLVVYKSYYLLLLFKQQQKRDRSTRDDMISVLNLNISQISNKSSFTDGREREQKA